MSQIVRLGEVANGRFVALLFTESGLADYIGEVRVANMGRFNTVTNGRFRVSEFNDRFPAMNLKRIQSPGDPFLTLAFLYSGRSG
ncbi:hypothetical protein, partial [Methylicorpusculum sp.]|uniref:hypothetical protein n=1 Tax=Methylicorpusculum sp. TaxID=2713644 RepID=UPI002ABAE6C3